MLPVRIHVSVLGNIEREYRPIIEFYETRISKLARWKRDSGKVGAESILLDPQGAMMSSDEFFALISKAAGEGRELHFVIGPPDGFDTETKSGKRLISLSPMTMRHELAYLVLLEQIYRALLRMKGTNYSH